jgi:hypothetical protein
VSGVGEKHYFPNGFFKNEIPEIFFCLLKELF